MNASSNNHSEGGHKPNEGGHKPNVPVTPPTNNNGSGSGNNNQGGSGGSNVFVSPIFFPSEQSFNKLVKTLDDAKKTLDICVYTLTDDQLAKAIIRVSPTGSGKSFFFPTLFLPVAQGSAQTIPSISLFFISLGARTRRKDPYHFG